MSGKDLADSTFRKIYWAKHLYLSLKNEIINFVKSPNFISIGCRSNLSTRNVEYFVNTISDTPPEIALKVGDILQNLRSALDHLIYSNHPDGKNDRTIRHLQFPIADTEDSYKKILPTYTKGLTNRFIQKINKQKPYKDGNISLWLIHKLNNIDKHRALLLVSLGNASLEGISLKEILSREMSEWPSNFLEDHFIKPADNLSPLKVGDILFTDQRRDLKDLNQRFRVNINILINEKDVLENKPLLPLLEELILETEKIYKSFFQ